MRKSRKPNRKTSRFTTTIKNIGLSFLALALSGFAYTSVASSSESSLDVDVDWHKKFLNPDPNKISDIYSLSYIATGNFALEDASNAKLLEEANEKLKEVVDKNSQECANPENPDGLGGVQSKEIEKQRQIDVSGIDLDEIFAIGKKGGCFDTLSNFPDLSTNIPSITGMINEMKNTLQQYAIRKTCSVVDDALEGALSPISNVMNDISDRGVLDLNGLANEQVKQQLYNIDPKASNTYKNQKSSADYSLGDLVVGGVAK